MLDKRIIRYLEEKKGSPIRASSDCERLALDIESATGERLGVTTLKRLLGFTSEKAQPRISTLDIIARYLGFESYSLLEDSLNNKGDSEFDDVSETILSSSLSPGEEIKILYSPDRSLIITHLEEDKFIVKESINGSLKEGDVIFVESLTSGLPLNVQDVIRNGESLGGYTAGKKFGIKL